MFTKIENAKIHYQVFGDGKPVIILHGLGCDNRLMKGCLEPIFQNLPDYKRIYIDLPGMGESDAPIAFGSSDGILQILISMITQFNLEHFLLVGESYGGYLARGILASQLAEQVDGLFLICPVAEPKHASRNLPVKNIKLFDAYLLQQLSSQKRDEFCEYAVVANEQTYKRYKQEIEPGLQLANKVFGENLIQNYAFTVEVDKKIRAKI